MAAHACKPSISEVEAGLEDQGWPGVMAYTFNPTAREAQAEGSLRSPALHNEFQTAEPTGTPCLKKPKGETKQFKVVQ